MIKKINYLLLILLLFVNCHPDQDKIPTGEWKYKLYVNGSMSVLRLYPIKFRMAIMFQHPSIV